jgi:nucleotidyltransferase substrate binding protein (TIGR01987 family)
VTKSQSLRADFTRAVTRPDEALALPKDPIVRDSAIQRFEISFELCWKYLKAYLEEQHNALRTSPRTCFRSAFRHGVIDNDPFWIDLTVLRNYNYTVHTYNELLADYVYSRLAETARRFRAVLAATVIEPD